MTELQAVELRLYKEYKRICDDNGLMYFATGGTCIGTIRHNGFIPWDDDIDVAMPIEDYKKFIRIAKNELKDGYEIYLIEEHPHWYRNFIKIHDTNTTFAEADSAEHLDRYTGVYMDIMPVYGMPAGKFSQLMASYINDYYQYMNRRQRIEYKNGRHFLDIVLKLPRIIHGRRRKELTLYNSLIDKKFGKYPYNNSDKVLFGWRDRIENAHLAFSYRTVFDYSDFSDTIDMNFEDTVMKMPIGYDHYLRTEFGDYMQLPPEDKRITHNTAIIDLNKPYKEYIKEHRK